MKKRDNPENTRDGAWEKDRYELEPKRKESSTTVGSDEDLDKPGAPTVSKQNQTTKKDEKGDDIQKPSNNGMKQNEIEDVEEKSPRI